MPKQVYSPSLKRRDLFWVGTTLDDLRAFPEEVRREMGHALHLAQIGDKSPDAKPLRGFKGAGVLEFQKKSHRGIATDQRDIELVEKRLQDAERIDREMRTKARR
jgi:phage-related protein